jgi:parallel beta-helix repeat protein
VKRLATIFAVSAIGFALILDASAVDLVTAESEVRSARGHLGRALDDIRAENTSAALSKIALAEADLDEAKTALDVQTSPSPTPSPTPSPPPSPPPSPEPEPVDCDVSLSSGASIQQAANSVGQGATLCLSGSFTIGNTVSLKLGQSVVGPAVITGTNGVDVGFAPVKDTRYVNLDASGFDHRPVQLAVGVEVIGGRYHHNGRNGLGGGLAQGGGVLIDGVEIDHNGSPEYLGVGAAGVKLAGSGGSTVINSYIHDNVGNGLWFDVDSGNGDLAENNVVTGNSRRGIFYEVSRGPVVIRGNTVQGNNTERLGNGAGIGVSSSKNVLIEGNILGGNIGGFGIGMGEVNRDNITWDYPLSNVVVRNNTMNGDAIRGCNQDGVTCSSNS